MDDTDLTKDQVSVMARALAARRRQVSSHCVVCGQPMVGTKKRRYCSAACRQRGYRAKQHAANTHLEQQA